MIAALRRVKSRSSTAQIQLRTRLRTFLHRPSTFDYKRALTQVVLICVLYTIAISRSRDEDHVGRLYDRSMKTFSNDIVRTEPTLLCTPEQLGNGNWWRHNGVAFYWQPKDCYMRVYHANSARRLLLSTRTLIVGNSLANIIHDSLCSRLKQAESHVDEGQKICGDTLLLTSLGRVSDAELTELDRILFNITNLIIAFDTGDCIVHNADNSSQPRQYNCDCERITALIRYLHAREFQGRIIVSKNYQTDVRNHGGIKSTCSKIFSSKTQHIAILDITQIVAESCTKCDSLNSNQVQEHPHVMKIL